MDKARLKFFNDMLLNERQTVVDTINSENKNGANDLLQDYYSELSVYDNHPADIATETYETEMRQNLKDHEKRILKEIDNALSKIHKGTYGICEDCGKEIELERLKILPSTRFCVNCKDESYTIKGKLDTRPVEEDILKYPFSRTFNDENNKNSFDGEDTWQSVARYNDIPNDPSFSGGDQYGYFDETEQGITQNVEQISEGYYSGQIQDLNRTDIPDRQRKDLKNKD